MNRGYSFDTDSFEAAMKESTSIDLSKRIGSLSVDAPAPASSVVAQASRDHGSSDSRGGDDTRTMLQFDSDANHSLTANGPVMVRLADVQPEQITWLWPGRIALGKLTLIAGDPGLGKSILTMDMAARVSRGAPWPDSNEGQSPIGDVILLSGEDDVADTIRPRLDAAEADLERISLLRGVRSMSGQGDPHERSVDLSKDIAEIEQAIQSVSGCRLVIIDPITAYLGRTDSHKNAEVRGVLEPLAVLASCYDVAVVAVTHLNKNSGTQAIHRTMGSVGFTAAARAVWVVCRDRDDEARRLLLPVKNNIGRDHSGLAFSIEESAGDSAPILNWSSEPVKKSADDALTGLGTGSGGPSELDDAVIWIGEYLREGPREVRGMLEDARSAGYSEATIRRARAHLRVMSEKSRFDGPWTVRLPGTFSSGTAGESPNALLEDAH